MILQTLPPTAGQAALLIPWLPFRTKVYFLVLGPGNVRWGTNQRDLETTSVPGTNSGLPQNAGAGEKEREWVGQLWGISDTANTTVVIVCPALDMRNAEFFQGKGLP